MNRFTQLRRSKVKYKYIVHLLQDFFPAVAVVIAKTPQMLELEPERSEWPVTVTYEP